MPTVVGFQQLTISTSAVSLTVPTRAQCYIARFSGLFRMRADGTAPTSSVGIDSDASAADSDGYLVVTNSSMRQIQFIRTGGSDATLDGHYFAEDALQFGFPWGGDEVVFPFITTAGFEQLTVGSSAVGLTPPSNASTFFGRLEDAQIRVRADGTDPDATTGVVVSQSDFVLVGGDSLSQVRFIRTGGSNGNIQGHYFVENYQAFGKFLVGGPYETIVV